MSSCHGPETAASCLSSDFLSRARNAKAGGHPAHRTHTGVYAHTGQARHTRGNGEEMTSLLYAALGLCVFAPAHSSLPLKEREGLGLMEEGLPGPGHQVLPVTEGHTGAKPTVSETTWALRHKDRKHSVL